MLKDVEKILVPIDGSNQARNAFFDAIDIAKRINAKILLISVVEESLVEENNKNPSSRTYTEARNELLQSYKTNAANQHAFSSVDTAFYIGDPKRVIVQVTKEDPSIGLIVMGATGKNAVERFVVGSVAQYVVRNATVPVLIVR